MPKDKKNILKNKKLTWWIPEIKMFSRLSIWIATPIIVGIFAGKWLDEKYKTKPWFFLTCIGIAFFISMIGLIYNTFKEFKKIEKNGPNSKD